MHPLRVLLYASFALAIAVAWGLGAALQHAGAAPAAALVLGIVAFVVFMIPWSGVFLWAVRRASDLDVLTDRGRDVAEGAIERPIADRAYHGELDDLARAMEEMRAALVRQREVHEEHRAAMAEIVASLGEGLLAINPQGRVVVANPRVGEMFGSGRELIGRSVLEVVRKQSVVAALDKALRGEASTDRVSVGSGDDERQIEVRAVPVEASPEIAAIALFIDVTTIERLQRIRKDFLDDFSHEVRTPLAGLRSASETLEQGDVGPETEQQLRQVMQRQLARIERLINDLAELNQIESGQLVLHRRPVHLKQVLGDLCVDFQGRTDSVRFILDGEDVIASIDAARAQQIFVNLLDNAAKHGGGRGEVRVEIARERDDAVIRVSDQGPGIPPHEVERIFHRFYRVDRSRSSPGTGLGLAIAKHLVVLHGGAIRAWNRESGGATFEVRLPLEA
jgi:two-component system, OmpR family, phosphate regulon sensor histidine kinase PhoR